MILLTAIKALYKVTVKKDNCVHNRRINNDIDRDRLVFCIHADAQ